MHRVATMLNNQIRTMKKPIIVVLSILLVVGGVVTWLSWQTTGAAETPAFVRSNAAPPETHFEYTNRLIHETSPYLLQHAHNPVDWYPWGEEAFAMARKENMPIFLSVGYSTCHWCHVMEHESFENPAIAKILNDNFVCIKVDREERPDVDGVYMAFVQATTGGGGWPMTVWLTPDLNPFFGGTYFPPEQLTAVANKIADAWKTDRAKIIASSDQVITALRNYAQPDAGAKDQIGSGIREQAFQEIASTFDRKLGGFGSAPKFPRPVTFDFLCHFYADHPDSKDGQRALAMTLFTLRQMAAGGIHDQLGGGFHRYSVDQFWHVPHFEKMLYDQAQLAAAYSTAFQITRDPQYETTTRNILEYVWRDLTDPAGGFYSAEDADSQVAADKPERAEGAFYIWTKDEIERVLGPERAKIFDYQFDVERNGNAPDGSDPRGELTGKNILIQSHTLAETAKQFGLTITNAEQSIAESRQLLLAARDQRPRPRRDDKIITAWNGLMISAYARAAQVLDDPDYRDMATRAATFVRQNLYRKKDQTLLRSYRDGAGDVAGFADDYAFMIQGLLDLYETTFDSQWIELATKLQTRQDQLFWDNQSGGYFTTAGNDPNILLRSKEDYDGAEPSPNSVAALNLLRLSQMFDRPDWRERAEKTLRAFSPQLQRSPSAMPQMLVALDWLRAEPKQIVIAGKPDASDTRALLREVNRHFIPDKIVLLADGGAGQKFFAAQIDFMKDVTPIHGEAAAYVCENFACQLPTTNPAALAELLARSKHMPPPPDAPHAKTTVGVPNPSERVSKKVPRLLSRRSQFSEESRLIGFQLTQLDQIQIRL